MKTTILLAALLAGCSFDTYVYPEMFIKANELCAPNGGLKYITDTATVYNNANAVAVGVSFDCNNGASFKFIKVNVRRA